MYGLLAHYIVRYAGDDMAFVAASKEVDLFHYVYRIFTEYSGRISAKTLEYLSAIAPLPLWRILEVICLDLTGLVFYGFFRLFHDNKHSVIALACCLCIPLLLHIQVLHETWLWIAGTTNYAFIILPGMYAAYIMTKRVMGVDLKLVEKILFFPLLIFSCMGSEQIAAVLLALHFLLFIWDMFHKSRDWLRILGLLVSAFCFFVCYVFSPGTSGRLAAETHYIPDYYTMPVAKHINYAFRWLMDAFVNRMGFLLTAGFVAAGFVLLDKSTIRKGFMVLAILCFVYALFTIAAVFEPRLTDFRTGWGRNDFTTKSVLILLFWGIGLVILFFSIVLSFSKTGKKIVCAVLLLGAAASLVLVTFSPTMYISGYRTTAVSAVMLSVVIAMLPLHRNDSTLSKVQAGVMMTIILIGSAFHYQAILKTLILMYKG